MVASPFIIERLRPHQVEPYNRLCDVLRTVDSAIDTSECGTGKTYTACAVAKTLGLPTLVVCPWVSVPMWKDVAAHFGDTISAINYESLRTGRTPFGKWDNNPPPGFKRKEFYVCESCLCKVDFDNYFPCYTNSAGIHCIITKKAKWRYGDFHFNPAVKFIIFDEGHRCGEIDSLNARMMAAAGNRKTLVLSATAATTPMQMQALGQIMRLHSGGNDFYRWARTHGCRQDEARHFRWMVSKSEQTKVMESIHDRLMERGVRVRTRDIPGFPARIIETVMVDVNDPQEIERLYTEMKSPLEALKKKQEAGIETPLTKILRARQKIELLKVPAAVEMANDLLASGLSISFFVNFRQTLEAICAKMQTDCIVDGSRDGVRYRHRNIARFQENSSRVIVCNGAAGSVSVSLQDLTGDHPRAGLIFPSFSAIEFLQEAGRLPREGGKTTALYRVLLASGTIEIKIKRAIDGKMDNLSMLNDGDLIPI